MGENVYFKRRRMMVVWAVLAAAAAVLIGIPLGENNLVPLHVFMGLTLLAQAIWLPGLSRYLGNGPSSEKLWVSLWGRVSMICLGLAWMAGGIFDLLDVPYRLTFRIVLSVIVFVLLLNPVFFVVMGRRSDERATLHEVLFVSSAGLLGVAILVTLIVPPVNGWPPLPVYLGFVPPLVLIVAALVARSSWRSQQREPVAESESEH
jgi:hypothetical protein